MKVLLLGEYSNVHWSLAGGLRALGHDVTVVSNGDFWKGYPCDIRLERKYSSRWDALSYLSRTVLEFRKFRGYDIVQLINPLFLELRARNILPFYRYLRSNNGKVFLDAYGMDRYYVKACLDRKFDYSELMIGDKFRDIRDNRIAVDEWMGQEKGPLNRAIAEDCDGIIAGLWEYYISYNDAFPEKTTYIPFPVSVPDKPAERYLEAGDGRKRFFIGVQRSRSEFKGTDILLPIMRDLENRYPERMTVTAVENVPYEEYCRLMRSSDVLVDQLYSPTPNMNSLLAMSQGLVVAGGGEEEPYRFIGEKELRPIINLPCETEEIRDTLIHLLEASTESLQRRKTDSITYVRRHHDPVQVAEKYIEFWRRR